MDAVLLCLNLISFHPNLGVLIMSDNMDPQKSSIPARTLEILVRGFYKESEKYGFKKVDYIRFVNSLLDIAMQGQRANNNVFQPAPNVGKIRKKKVKLPIKAKEMTIRSFEDKDRAIIDLWLDDHEGRRFLVSSVTARIASFDSLLNDKNCDLAVVTLPQGVPIGMLAFLNIDPDQKKAELRKMIGDPSFRGHGYGKKATQLWIRYGLTTLGLRKIYLNTLNTNIRNIKLNEELGFKVEGVLRNEVYFEGEYHDVLRMGLVV